MNFLLRSRYSKYFFALLLVALTALNSCYYDNEEELYGLSQGPCDSLNVTYSSTLVPLMQSYCNACHTPSNPGGGYITSTWAGVKQMADDGSLMGSISFSPGFSPMPKGANKLSDCDIAKIRKWINDGKQNN